MEAKQVGGFLPPTCTRYFFHRNVIQYCDRPFTDVLEMNEWMIEQWNKTIGKDDIVYIVGDFAINFNKATKEIFHRLNGNLILIVGNHDAPFYYLVGRASNKRKYYQKYLDLGWKTFKLEEQITLKSGVPLLLSHLPYAIMSNYDDRYLEYRPKNYGLILAHGHQHGKYKKNGTCIDVGIDAWGGKIVTEDMLIEVISDTRTFIDKDQWYK